MSKPVLFNYGDIEVKAKYEIARLLQLEITAEANEHIRLKYTGEIPEDKKDEYITSSKYNDVIQVFANTDEGPLMLFSGNPAHIEVEVSGNMHVLKVEALSHSFNLDVARHRRSFQPPGMTYKGVSESIGKNYGKMDCQCRVPDAINIFTLQYDETDWRFFMRLASRFSTVLIPDCTTDFPQFYFGLPLGNSYEISETQYSITRLNDLYRETTQDFKRSATELDFTGIDIVNSQYMKVGDNVSINKISGKVAKSRLVMENGVLRMYYTVMQEKAIRKDPYYNKLITGLSLAGNVIGRNGSLVQIKLDIDGNHPDCGARWFRYDSNYTTGSYGWYVMPEMGHMVNLYMPDENEKNAYSVASIRRKGHAKASDVREKRLGTHHYKEFLMDNEQLKITARDKEEGQMYIQMKHEDGIKLVSDYDISLRSKEDITFAANKVNIQSADTVYFLNKPSSIRMDGETKFFGPIIDKHSLAEGELTLPPSKRAKIFKTPEGSKVSGVFGHNVGTKSCVGDPVDVVSGNHFSQQNDLHIRGAMPLTFTRTYNALNGVKGAFGEGWRHSFEAQFIINGNTFTLHHGDGRMEYFFRHTDGVIRSANHGYVYEDTENKLYTHRDYLGKTYCFNEKGQLKTVIKDRNIIQLEYDKDKLVVIRNEGGFISLTYYNDKLMALVDSSGRRVEYAFDGEMLVKVRNVNGGSFKYSYDSDKQITEIIDPKGNIMVQNTYDQKGRVIRQRMPEGGEVSLDYNDVDRITTFTERDDTQTQYIRDSRDFIRSTKTIDGEEIQELDYLGRKTAFTDRNGNTTQYEYGDTHKETNPLGETTETVYNSDKKIVSRIAPDGGKTTFEYDEQGNMTAQIDPMGNRMILAYDSSGNIISITSPEGIERRFTYDSRGNLASVIDGEGNATKITYDTANRLTGFQRPEGQVTTFEYNAIDKVTKMKNPDGTNASREYDLCGLLSAETDEAGTTTRYEYYADGKIKKKTDPLGNVTKYYYTVTGRLAQKTNPDSSKRQYFYNEAGRLATEKDEEGAATRFFYDANGNVIKRVDPNGNPTKYVYDGLNRVIQKTDAEGNKTLITFNCHNKTTQQIDADGGKTLYEYDLCGRITAVTDPLGAVRRFGYNGDGKLIKKTNPYDAETLVEYNKIGKVTKMTYPDGTLIEVDYDKNGRMIHYRDQEGNETGYAYDDMGRVKEVTNPLGHKQQFTYSPVGKLASITDANGNKTTYLYDLNKNLTGVINAAGFQIRYVYYRMNRLTEIHKGPGETVKEIPKGIALLNKNKNMGKAEPSAGVGQAAPDTGYPESLMMAYRYNDRGQVVQEINAKRLVKYYSYDDAGNLIEVADRDGTAAQFEYDAVNNPIKKTYTDGEQEMTARYQYDPMGRVIAVIDWLGKTSYDLDALGRLTRLKTYDNQQVSYGWGSLGERLFTQYPDGTRASYEYDPMGRLSSVAYQNRITAYEYTPTGRIALERFPNGAKTGYQYDAAGQMIKLSHFQSKADLRPTEERSFEYNPAGFKTKKSTVMNTPAQGLYYAPIMEKDKGTTTYGYDALNQLIRVSAPDYASTAFTYDDFGNRTGKSVTGQGQNINVSYIYDELNRLVEQKGKDILLGFETDSASYSYDNRGNLVRISGRETNIAEYSYDIANNLIHSVMHDKTIVGYQYDSSGRRVSKEIDGGITKYLPDVTMPFNEVLTTEKDSDSRNYIYNNQMPIGYDENHASQLNTILKDEMFSPSRIVDPEGRLISKSYYDVLGNTATYSARGDQIIDAITYTGYGNDSETGLMYVQNRYYLPELGRFTQEDSNKGNAFNPKSLNLYMHCYNNPLSFVDKDGHEGFPILLSNLCSFYGYDPNNLPWVQGENGGYSYVELNINGKELTLYINDIDAAYDVIMYNGIMQNKTFVSEAWLATIGLEAMPLRWAYEANGYEVKWYADTAIAEIIKDGEVVKTIDLNKDEGYFIDSDNSIKILLDRSSGFLEDTELLFDKFDMDGTYSLTQAEAILKVLGHELWELASLIKVNDDGMYQFICSNESNDDLEPITADSLSGHIGALKRLYFEKSNTDTTFLMSNDPESLFVNDTDTGEVLKFSNEGGYLLKSTINTDKAHLYFNHSNRNEDTKLTFAVIIKSTDKSVQPKIKVLNAGGATTNVALHLDAYIYGYNEYLMGNSHNSSLHSDMDRVRSVTVSDAGNEDIILLRLEVPEQVNADLFAIIAGNITFQRKSSAPLEIIVAVFRGIVDNATILQTNYNEFMNKDNTTGHVSGYTKGDKLITKPVIDVVSDFKLADGRDVDFIAFETGSNYYSSNFNTKNNINAQVGGSVAEQFPFTVDEGEVYFYGRGQAEKSIRGNKSKSVNLGNLGNWSVTYDFSVTFDNSKGVANKTFYYFLLTVAQATLFLWDYKTSIDGRLAVTDDSAEMYGTTLERYPGIIETPNLNEKYSSSAWHLAPRSPSDLTAEDSKTLEEELKTAQSTEEVVSAISSTNYTNEKYGMLRYQIGLGSNTLGMTYIGEDGIEASCPFKVTVNGGEKVVLQYKYMLGTNVGAPLYHIWSENNIKTLSQFEDKLKIRYGFFKE